jgi:hypothetical protein
MKRALSVNDLLNKHYKLFEFTDKWLAAFGFPARTGVWFIYAAQGNGKTSFLVQLIKYLATFEKVVYNSLEESSDHTLQLAFKGQGMQDVSRRVSILEAESLAEMEERMNRRKAAKIWVVDTVQYLDMDWEQYIQLKRRHRDKLIIFVSHMEGNAPDGKMAMKIMRDAALKIFITGFVAISKGRYIGETGKYVIWNKGAQEIWGDKINDL